VRWLGLGLRLGLGLGLPLGQVIAAAWLAGWLAAEPAELDGRATEGQSGSGSGRARKRASERLKPRRVNLSPMALQAGSCKLNAVYQRPTAAVSCLARIFLDH